MRFSVGILFLTNSFLMIAQQPAVLNIFFSMLGLMFVEKFDEVIFAVSMRGEMPGATVQQDEFPHLPTSHSKILLLNANITHRILWSEAHACHERFTKYGDPIGY